MPSEVHPRDVTPAEDAEDLVLRPAAGSDAAALADLFLAVREAAYPAMPRPVHAAGDVHRWWHERLSGLPGVEAWLAESGEDVVGLMLLDADWLDALYVDPAWSRRGVGSALLQVAQSLRPGGLGLWVFVTNVAAQRLYRRHGFGEVRRTDGSGNEEGAPDIEMAWPDPGRVPGPGSGSE